MAPKKHAKTGPKARKSQVKASAGKNQTLSYGGTAKTKSTKNSNKPKISKVVTTTTTRTEVDYDKQIHTTNRSYKSIQMDEKRKAKLPGKRVSASGRVYYERRANRSDTKGERQVYDDKYGRR